MAKSAAELSRAWQFKGRTSLESADMGSANLSSRVYFRIKCRVMQLGYGFGGVGREGKRSAGRECTMDGWLDGWMDGGMDGWMDGFYLRGGRVSGWARVTELHRP